MTNILWFVPIKNNKGKLTIQSEVGETYDEAAAKVLANPKLENVVSYGRLVDDKIVWVDLNEQN